MKIKYFLFPIFTLIVTSGFALQSCSPAETAHESEDSILAQSAPSLVRTVILEDLENPWDLAFAPDGSFFFTEKCRGLSVQKADGSRKRLFGTEGSSLVAKDFFCEGQSGMHGVALDPEFSKNRTLYVFMPSNLNTSPRTNRIIRLVVAPDFSSVSQRQDIVTDIAFKDSGNNWGGAGSHSGGRIRFGPDGLLYITTGDNHNGTLPQDLSRLGGKVLRVDRNGRAADGNKTPSGGDPRIFTYGHRNVQGLDFHPQTGQVFIAEHGPGHSDEITPLIAGGNGGWDPRPGIGVSCKDNYCGYISNKANGVLTPMTDADKFADALQPVWRLNDSSGMGPCVFLKGSKWKSWNGALAVGVMASQKLDIVQIKGTEKTEEFIHADLPEARMRSLVLGPDENLYIATDEGEIWKITPQ